MSTAQDVRAAFQTLADQAPTEIDLEAFTVAAPPARHRLRPLLAVGGAVAAVVAAVVAVAMVVAPDRHGPPPATPPGVPLQVGFTVGSANGRQPELTEITPTYQEMLLSGGSTFVRVYTPGTFDPTKLQDARRVSAKGLSGYVGHLPPSGPYWNPDGQVFAWRYARGSWALVSNGAPDTAQNRSLSAAAAIARTVHVGRTTPLKVPFRLGYLPGGLAATSASNDPHSPVNEGVITFNTDKLIVTVNHQGLDDAVPHCSGAGSKRVTVHGYHGCFRDDDGVGGGRRLELAVPDGWLTVQVRSSHVFSDAVLKRIAASVTLASKLDDPSTWFDAETALSR
jgi:hypothetical protein